MEDLASLLILKKSFVLYKVVEREWVETRTYLLQKIPQDDDVQNNPEHDDFKQRYKAFLEKHRSDLEENKLKAQKRQRSLRRKANIVSQTAAGISPATCSKMLECSTQCFGISPRAHAQTCSGGPPNLVIPTREGGSLHNLVATHCILGETSNARRPPSSL